MKIKESNIICAKLNSLAIEIVYSTVSYLTHNNVHNTLGHKQHLIFIFIRQFIEHPSTN